MVPFAFDNCVDDVKSSFLEPRAIENIERAEVIQHAAAQFVCRVNSVSERLEMHGLNKVFYWSKSNTTMTDTRVYPVFKKCQD